MEKLQSWGAQQQNSNKDELPLDFSSFEGHHESSELQVLGWNPVPPLQVLQAEFGSPCVLCPSPRLCPGDAGLSTLGQYHARHMFNKNSILRSG